MAIDYRISKIVIRGFRGIDSLDLELDSTMPTVLIGSNNAGKSTILNAVALAFESGGLHNWVPTETDFFCDSSGNRADEFLIRVLFHSGRENGYPAVQGVGKPIPVYGVQVKGKRSGRGQSHTHALLDSDLKAFTFSPSTKLSEEDKKLFSDHKLGFRPRYGRVRDIRANTPDLWFFQPKDIEASLYRWKRGPLALLSKLLAERFFDNAWTFTWRDGKSREMPGALAQVYEFFEGAIEAFPFWTKDMKPRLESIFERYVGRHARIDLKPDVLSMQEWLAQQLQVPLATDQDCPSTPLDKMGDGWQSVIRLAALEAVSEYPDLSNDRIFLLLEEPETHLHPHLRRKMRKVLAVLSAKGWTILYTTHSPELVSFDEAQSITRLVRSKGKILSESVDTRKVEESAKLQSKLDESGSHDFLFGTGAVFCEGIDDTFALRSAFDQEGFDYDARSVSITQCGGVTAIPAFARIATKLGIRWCALTDEDKDADGTIKPKTEQVRRLLAKIRRDEDRMVEWPGSLEQALQVTTGKATPEVTAERLSEPNWKIGYPHFADTVTQIVSWASS